ncbi:MAG: O-antigen ligase domain-containing protein, partial [Calditrichaeota bacterium]
ALLCIIIIWDHKWRFMKKLFFFVCAIILFSAALLANSRGPMLSFLLVIGFLFARKMIKQPRFQYVLILLAGVAFVLLLVSLLPENLTNRYDLTQLTSNPTEKLPVNTVATRLHFWSVSVDMALRSPRTFLIGNGIGSFAREIYAFDFRWYPHNIFFEILSEQGMIGLVFFLFLIGSTGVAASRIIQSTSGNQRKIAITFLVLFIYFLLCAQFSGDLNDNRRIWFLIGLIGAQYRFVFDSAGRPEEIDAG